MHNEGCSTKAHLDLANYAEGQRYFHYTFTYLLVFYIIDLIDSQLKLNEL